MDSQMFPSNPFALIDTMHRIPVGATHASRPPQHRPGWTQPASTRAHSTLCILHSNVASRMSRRQGLSLGDATAS